MDSAAFQCNKIRRLIATQGQEFQFQRQGANDFGEPNGQTEFLTLMGVYHEIAGFLSKNSTEGSTTRKQPNPMILCLWEDALLLQHTDELVFNSKKYHIAEIRNILECNIAADISLQVIQDG